MEAGATGQGRRVALGVYDDADAAADNAGTFLANALAQVVEQNGQASLAVSGGRSPWRMLRKMSEADLPWERIDIFQVDERVAPDGDESRNLTHLRESLPEAAQARIVPMPVGDGDLERAALRYQASLPPRLDIVHLGLGADGHTASLVPGDPVLDIDNRRVALTGGEYQGQRRMTLTYPGLQAVQAAIWLVTGDDKREPLHKMLEGDVSIPAGRVAIPDTIVVADRAAAADLPLEDDGEDATA